MAIKDKVNSAWQEIETLNIPVNGAYQEADHANALVSGAWQEIWASQKPLTIISFNDDYDMLELSDDKTQLRWSTEANDSKTLRVCTAEDTYTNVVISFSYYGGRTYFRDDSAQGGNSQAGTLKIIGVRNGSATTLKSITLGSSSSDTSDYIEDFTISGTFTQIGFEITTNSMSTIYDVYTDIDIYDVIIDGKPYKFDL